MGDEERVPMSGSAKVALFDEVKGKLRKAAELKRIDYHTKANGIFSPCGRAAQTPPGGLLQ